MIELRAGGHVGRVENGHVSAVSGRECGGIAIRVHRTIDQTAGAGRVGEPCRGVVRPAVVPTIARSIQRERWVTWGRTTVIIVCLSEKGRTHGIASRLPADGRSGDIVTARRATIAGVPHNVRLLAVRTGQIDIQVPGVGVLDVEANIQDIVGGIDHVVIGKAGEGQRRPVGTTVGVAGDAVRKENRVRPGFHRLMGADLEIAGGVMPDGDKIGVSRAYPGDGDAVDRVRDDRRHLIGAHPGP